MPTKNIKRANKMNCTSKEEINFHIDNSNQLLMSGFGINACEDNFTHIVSILQNGDESIKTNFLNRVHETMLRIDTGTLTDNLVSEELILLIYFIFKWKELKIMADNRLCTLFHNNIDKAESDICLIFYQIDQNCWEDVDCYAGIIKRIKIKN